MFRLKFLNVQGVISSLVDKNAFSTIQTILGGLSDFVPGSNSRLLLIENHDPEEDIVHFEPPVALAVAVIALPLVAAPTTPSSVAANAEAVASYANRVTIEARIEFAASAKVAPGTKAVVVRLVPSMGQLLKMQWGEIFQGLEAEKYTFWAAIEDEIESVGSIITE